VVEVLAKEIARQAEDLSDQARKLAEQVFQALSDAGVKLILGGHPHVLQPMQWFNGKQTFAIYSQASFMSGQIYPANKQGGITEVTFKRGEDGQVTVTDPKFMPIYITGAENAEFSNIPAPSASAPLSAGNNSAREAAASAPVSPLPPLAQRPDSADTKPEEPPAEPEQETAPARGQRAQQEQSDEEDVVSDDDERIENSVHIGLRAIEKIIGGKVIDERPLHQI